MITFASIDDFMSHLRDESIKGERFATRFILIQGCQTWKDLIQRLIYEVDRVIRLSEFCSAPDVLPDMMGLISYLQEEIMICQSILLTPVSECIRLDPESAEVIRLLAEWPANKIRRIYVPLLVAEELFVQEINRVVRYRAGELPEPWSLKGEGSSEIIVAPFSTGFTERQIARGIKEYLSLWEQDSIRKVWLVTAMAPWLPVRQARSECHVRLYPSSFEYIRRNIDWEEICEEWGSSEQWDWLAVQIREGDNLDRLAGRLLNIANYNADVLFTLWGSFDHNKRWLAWLWSKRRIKPGTYLHYVLKENKHIDGFINDAVMGIFALPRSVSVSRERKELLQHLDVSLMPAVFWYRYNEFTDPFERLAVLTDLSTAEREQLVLCVSELMTKYPRDVWWDYLKALFPALTWYLRPAITGDEFADHYFSVYNSCRLKDQIDEELTTLITRWAGEQLLWSYPGKSDLLSRLRAAGSKILWVDAMGAEWAGLLTRLLTMNDRIECDVRLTRANLPTTTEANKEWEDGEEVIRDLDDIAHHYTYQFPDSFLKAIEVIKKVADKALALLSQYPSVVITSDHGLSRFAAISDVKVDAPKGAKVEAPGRYALLEGEAYDNNGIWVMENGNAYLLTHNRFKGGNACHGEVHSGATPEEYLTPVIIVRKISTLDLPQFEVLDTIVKLNTTGQGFLTIRCNRKVADVELRVAGYTLSGQSGAGFTWSFNLEGWKTGKYTGELYSANRSFGEINFEVLKGILQDDLGL
ncbi:BREX-4 system phosphatase PglZ [Moorella naiadis]|uniref:BREX-4 system phosphatase PglZ n=1 Tax=Moorella naiadis (nom. illeg.) TaxID=3093670 RepID=UPI003D9CB5B8